MLAAILGLTTRRLQTLKSDGVLQPRAKGRWHLAECVQAYTANLKGADKGAATNRNAAELELTLERTAKLKHENAVAQREVITLDEGRWIVERFVAGLRAEVMGIAARSTRDATLKAKIDAECAGAVNRIMDNAERALAEIEGGVDMEADEADVVTKDDATG